MLLQPAGTLATGTITLPLNTGVPDGTSVLITTTQEITSLTISLNGATALYGGVTFLGAGTATAIRFYQPTNSWYQINADTVYGANVQAFLAVPSSANLRAAMTDETGTGLLVFNNTPTLITPILGIPTSGTLTNCTGLPVATGISGLGASVATFLATPSSANLAAALTDETGTGANVFANTPTITNPTVSTGTFTSPALVTPALGTVASGVISACTSTSMVMVTPVIGAATGTSLSTTGNQVITGTGKQGYAVGAGGGVLQATSKATAVTLNKSCGQITMNGAALAASTTVSFTMTNSTVESGDIIVMNHISGGTLGSYTFNASCGVGTADINVRNVSLGSLSEAVILRFAVIKVVDT